MDAIKLPLPLYTAERHKSPAYYSQTQKNYKTIEKQSTITPFQKAGKQITGQPDKTMLTG
jgi:hypothetical protein